MITTELKYNQQSKETIKLKKIFNASLLALAVVLIVFTILFMVLAFKEKNTLGFYNLFFSVICIILQTLLILLICYDFYYLNKVEKSINKTGSYEISLYKPLKLTNKKFKNSTYLNFGIAIVVLIIAITNLVVILIKKNFYDSFVSIITMFNCFIYIMFCLTACGYSDLLHYNTYLELEKLSTAANNSLSVASEPTEVFKKNKTIVADGAKLKNSENKKITKTNTKSSSVAKATSKNQNINTPTKSLIAKKTSTKK